MGEVVSGWLLVWEAGIAAESASPKTDRGFRDALAPPMGC